MLHPTFEALDTSSLLESWGASPSFASVAAQAIIIAIVIAVAWIASFVVRRVIVRTLHRLALGSKVTWDNRIVERRVLVHLARVVPGVIFYVTAPLLGAGVPWLITAVHRAAAAWIILTVALTLDAALNAFHDIYHEHHEFARQRPIKGLLQLAKVLLFAVAAVLAITTLLDQSPIGILSGLGAMSAVLLLIFRDSILGFVSGIQLSANNMVQIGDWIEMPKYEADGDVIDITLQTIKVQNWDKTITTIPIYALVSDSFRNWRGMTESGGRRIKRAINIDMRSVKFLDDDMFERFRRFSRIRDYLDERKADIERYNIEHNIDLSDSVSGRRMTNLGTFRAYITAYLRNHPQIRQDMTFLVRQLPPGPTGIPIEIFVFSADQRWPAYEGIQADIFDHLLGVIPEFDLRVYQEPCGSDLARIAEAIERTSHTSWS